MNELVKLLTDAGLPVSQLVLVIVLYFGYLEMKALRLQLAEITKVLLDLLSKQIGG